MQHKKTIGVTMAAIGVILLFGCKSCNKTPVVVEGDDSVALNPAYAENPPVVKELFIEKIEDNNSQVLLLVRFAEGQVKEPLLAIDNEGEKVVLRDDGKKGDAQAGDGMFSSIVSLTADEVKTLLDDQQSLFQKNNGQLEVFEGRTLVTVNMPERAQDMKAFTDRKRIDLRFLLPCTPAAFDTPTVIKNCIMVTDLAVVQDLGRTWNVTAPTALRGNPNGVWTFWELMRQLASPDPAHIATDKQTSDFILLEWLINWNPQTINGELIPGRMAALKARIINQWQSSPTGPLVSTKTPFRLMAIANRVDQRGTFGYGATKNGGEGRLVFCATENGNALPFTVIFEYGINKSGCDVQTYAKQWYALKSLTLGSPAYNSALQAITMQFTQCGTNPAAPNQSSLNQLRTNEIALASPWELREFKLSKPIPTTVLQEVTVRREPAKKYNKQVANADVKMMAKWVNDNAAAYLIAGDNGIDVPDLFPGTSIPFLGGHALTESPPVGIPPAEHHWDANHFPGPDSIHNPLVRHYFSLNTCSGCHGGETQTSFTHLDPANFNTQTTPSRFLTGVGMPVTDAAARPQPVPNKFFFSDLKRRAIDLHTLVNCPCTGFAGLRQKLLYRPITSSH